MRPQHNDILDSEDRISLTQGDFAGAGKRSVLFLAVPNPRLVLQSAPSQLSAAFGYIASCAWDAPHKVPKQR